MDNIRYGRLDATDEEVRKLQGWFMLMSSFEYGERLLY